MDLACLGRWLFSDHLIILPTSPFGCYIDETGVRVFNVEKQETELDTLVRKWPEGYLVGY